MEHPEFRFKKRRLVFTSQVGRDFPLTSKLHKYGYLKALVYKDRYERFKDF